MKLWWECPDCKSKIDFTKQVSLIFEDDGEAVFSPNTGFTFHLILCKNCGNGWTLSMSGKEKYNI